MSLPRFNLPAIGLLFAQQRQMIADWERAIMAYGVPSPRLIRALLSKPRWGQPGRKRRRKNRQQARALEMAKRLAGATP